jgi:hypothetical protein
LGLGTGLGFHVPTQVPTQKSHKSQYFQSVPKSPNIFLIFKMNFNWLWYKTDFASSFDNCLNDIWIKISPEVLLIDPSFKLLETTKSKHQYIKMSIQIKILEYQQPQPDPSLKYTETFKKKFFGVTVVANISHLEGNKTLEEVIDIFRTMDLIFNFLY